MPVLLGGSKTMVWKEKEGSRIRAIQMEKFSGLLCTRRIDRLPNTRVR